LIFAAAAATERWGALYRAIIRLWKNLWEANAIESLNAQYRRAIKARGHFPRSRRPETAV
jgi:transposase-like protein